MKRKELEMRLQRVAPFDDPSAALEQYPTPSTIASDILFSAYANGDVCDKTVNDLGCGTGIFSIGAKLLGANVVRGYDISRSALDVARKNIARITSKRSRRIAMHLLPDWIRWT